MRMSVVFGLFGLILAACGVALIGAGVKTALDGEVAATAVGITIGLLSLYSACIFARQAMGVRKALAGDSSVRSQYSRELRYFAAYIAAGVLIALALPVSTLAKTVIAVMITAAAIAGMALRVNPPWRSRKK